MTYFEQKRANTKTELLGLGLEKYTISESGEYIATLNYKQWGKSINMWVYFTLDNGQKIKLSCFRSRKNRAIYSARDEKYNFTIVGNEGCKFKIVVGRTKDNKPAFLSATQI